MSASPADLCEIKWQHFQKVRLPSNNLTCPKIGGTVCKIQISLLSTLICSIQRLTYWACSSRRVSYCGQSLLLLSSESWYEQYNTSDAVETSAYYTRSVLMRSHPEWKRRFCFDFIPAMRSGTYTVNSIVVWKMTESSFSASSSTHCRYKVSWTHFHRPF